ncbi:helix-turn-helix transcriptional regulator [Psychroserpens mesophilus]|uniref:helix-turn-helix transcriptional regulator n=1 Tax=Psychroserpens mesophilus TaxID=325473 RepID=UPI003D64BF78
MEYSKNQAFLIEFGKNLRKIRKSKDLTQAELASDLDVEISQISRIERGVINTSISTAYEIAKILDTNISDLFNFDI